MYGLQHAASSHQIPLDEKERRWKEISRKRRSRCEDQITIRRDERRECQRRDGKRILGKRLREGKILEEKIKILEGKRWEGNCGKGSDAYGRNV